MSFRLILFICWLFCIFWPPNVYHLIKHQPQSQKNPNHTHGQFQKCLSNTLVTFFHLFTRAQSSLTLPSWCRSLSLSLNLSFVRAHFGATLALSCLIGDLSFIKVLWFMLEKHSIGHKEMPSIGGKLDQHYQALSLLTHLNRHPASLQFVFSTSSNCLFVLLNSFI